jgi:hypothetical protein
VRPRWRARKFWMPTVQGEKIVAAKDFSVIETKQLYHIKIQGSDGKIYQNCVYRHSRN